MEDMWEPWSGNVNGFQYICLTGKLITKLVLLSVNNGSAFVSMCKCVVEAVTAVVCMFLHVNVSLNYV